MYDRGKDGRFAFDQRPRLQPPSPKQNSTSICALKVLNESKYQMPREGRKRVRAVQGMISVCGWTDGWLGSILSCIHGVLFDSVREQGGQGPLSAQAGKPAHVKFCQSTNSGTIFHNRDLCLDTHSVSAAEYIPKGFLALNDFCHSKTYDIPSVNVVVVLISFPWVTSSERRSITMVGGNLTSSLARSMSISSVPLHLTLLSRARVSSVIQVFRDRAKGFRGWRNTAVPRFHHNW